MISWIKKHFIPHEGNDHRPHFLHGKNARTIVTLVLVLELIAFIVPTLTFVGVVSNSNLASVLPGVLASLTNEERKQNQLPNLAVNTLLNQAAQMKAEDMAAKSYFAHTSPEGLTPWHWLDAVGYRYDYAGENLAINFTDSQDVTEAWMNSPTHRANIVKSSYREVGTGMATGIYEGKETLFVVQVYANPRSAEAAPIVPKEGTVQTNQMAINESPVTNILGAETEVTAASATLEPTPVVSEPVAKMQIDQQAGPTFIEKLMASPRHTFNTVLYFIIALMLVALVLNVAIKFNIQHPDLITNGLAVVAIVGAIFVTNNFISNRGATISQSDYSIEQVQSGLQS